MRDSYCKTRYPILLVHGLGCRDEVHGGYWGRIPAVLRACGAAVYHGGQDAWGSIAGNAAQLQPVIAQMLREQRTEKVHIIAHSKGGLEARYLITRLGLSAQVASLSMLSTPNRGSPIADALRRNPVVFGAWRAQTQWYWPQHGDVQPDFDRVAEELSPAFMARFNAETPDMPGVFYQSWGARLGDDRSDAAMVWCDRLFRGLHGESDGLVSPASARWGVWHGVLDGVSHQQLCDAFRHDLPHFNVRKLYCALVHDLKKHE